MKRKTLTILFVDLQGYTSRTARQTRGENELLIQELKSFIQKNTTQHGGAFVKAMGDGFLLTFESPTDAITCGQAMQTQIEQRNSNVLNKDNFIRFRIGISTGEVNIDEDGDVYGDAVNIASRIQGFAEPNDVYISEATYLAMNKSEIHALDLGPKMFKNALKEVRVYKVLKNAPGQVSPSGGTKISLPPSLLFGGAIMIAMIALLFTFLRQEPDIEKLFADEEYHEVIELAEELFPEDPENLLLHELLIKSLIKLKDYEQAHEHFRNAKEMLPDIQALCPPIIEFLVRDGKRHLAQKIERKHCSLDARRDRRDNRFRDFQNNNQQRDQRQQSFDQRSQSNDRQRDSQRQRFDPERRQRQNIDQLMQDGNFDEVIRMQEERLERNPHDMAAREMLSETFMQMQDYDRAEQILRESVEMMPEAHHLLWQMADVLEQKGDYPQAIDMLHQFAEQARDDAPREEAYRRIQEIEQRME